jgi:hypothetical protein
MLLPLISTSLYIIKKIVPGNKKIKNKNFQSHHFGMPCECEPHPSSEHGIQQWHKVNISSDDSLGLHHWLTAFEDGSTIIYFI